MTSLYEKAEEESDAAGDDEHGDETAEAALALEGDRDGGGVPPGLRLVGRGGGGLEGLLRQLDGPERVGGVDLTQAQTGHLDDDRGDLAAGGQR